MNLTPYEIEKAAERKAWRAGYDVALKLALCDESPGVNICKKPGGGCDNCPKFDDKKLCFDLKTFKTLLKWKNS